MTAPRKGKKPRPVYRFEPVNPMRRPATARQRECFDAIVKLAERNGFPPTLRELGALLGISTTKGVSDTLDRLAAKGWITRERLCSRVVRVLGAEPRPARPRRREIPGATAAR